MQPTIAEGIEQYGFWAMFLFLIVKELAIPVTNRLLPAKVKHEQELQERRLAAELALEERRVAASEKDAEAQMQIAKAIATNTERLNGFESLLREYGQGHLAILNRLDTFSNSPRRRNPGSAKRN